MNTMNMSLLTMLAMQYLGQPYIYGDNGPFSFDCSSFVQKVLKDADIITDNRDRTAQGIYDYLQGKYFQYNEPASNCVLFFGKSTSRITHIGIAVNEEFLIHAGGGGRNVKTIEDAREKDARVKIQRIDYRNDLVACIRVTTKDITL